METFTGIKDLVDNPHYQDQRERHLAGLAHVALDAPMVDIINGFNALPHCFTLQSCYGHFVHSAQKDPKNLEPLPARDSTSKVAYRIAYIAFCIEKSLSGEGLFNALGEITAMDPDNVQFCCAKWFWKRQVNSYALQVEPDRFKHQDKAIIDYEEALYIERIRNEFFFKLKALMLKQQV